MISLLAKLFIKHPARSPEGRRAYGTLCGIAGIIFNLLLFTGKYIVGTLTFSLAITADAFNNLSDAASSLLTLIGFRLSGKKPDAGHPFGHGRIEYITGLAVSIVILIVGFELLKDSIAKIITPEEVSANVVTFCVLAASVLVKLYMFIYNLRISKKIDSAAMRASALDSISDSAATLIVILCTVISTFTGVPIDGYGGLLVSAFILFTGFTSCRDTLAPLLGQPPEKEFINEIQSIVMSHKEIMGMHDLVVHDYGPGRMMISLHAEVDGSKDIFVLHDEIDLIERELTEKLGCETVIHMDPIAVNDPEIDSLRDGIHERIKEIDPEITMHDFRIVKGPTHTNAIFDIVVPFDVKKSNDEIKAEINTIMQKDFPNTFAVVDIDRPYV